MTRKRRQKSADKRAAAAVASQPGLEPATPELAAANRPVLIAATLTAAVAFFAYVRTLAPGMHFGDGMELSTAARVLGVPHPTGYPIYMLLLHAFTWLPLGEVAARTALASAMAMGASAGLTTMIVNDLLASAVPRMDRKAVLIAAACGGLTCAFLRLAWDNAVVTEVYGFHLLLMLAFLRAAQGLAYQRQPRALATAALAVGLGLAHHRLAILALPPLAGLAWHLWRSERQAARRQIAAAALCLIVPLAFYAYLPLRAAARPPLNWGDASSVRGFLDHIRGRGYVEYRILQPVPGQAFDPGLYARFLSLVSRQAAGAFLDQVVPVAMTSVSDTAFQRAFPTPNFFPSPVRAGVFTQPLSGGVERLFGMLLLGALGLGAVGIATLLRRAPIPAAMALVLGAFHLSMIFLYNIADIGDYCLVPFWFGWGAVWIGLLVAGARLLAWVQPVTALRPEMAYAFVVLPLSVAAVNFPRCDRSRDTQAEEFSYFILPESRELMPEGSVLMTAGDADIFTCWYRQIVRRERRDVLVFGSNFVHRPWYSGFFTDKQIADYSLKFAAAVPTGPESFAQQLQEGLLEANVGRVPVFTTLEDPLVLAELSRHYLIRPVAAKGVRGLLPGTVETTVTLLRLEPRRMRSRPQ